MHASKDIRQAEWQNVLMGFLDILVRHCASREWRVLNVVDVEFISSPNLSGSSATQDGRR